MSRMAEMDLPEGIDGVQEVLIARVPKIGDMETALRLIVVDGEVLPELRDYIPDLGTFGRGYWISNRRRDIEALIRGLESLLDQATD